MRILFVRPLLLASAAFLSASPLLAAGQRDEAPAAQLAAWVDAVNAKVERAIDKPDIHGFVLASFRRGQDGRATDIRIDGVSPEMRDVARMTLRRIGRLPPLPKGFDPYQRVKLQMLLDDTDVAAFRRKREALLALAEAENRRMLENRAHVRMASAGDD